MQGVARVAPPRGAGEHPHAAGMLARPEFLDPASAWVPALGSLPSDSPVGRRITYVESEEKSERYSVTLRDWLTNRSRISRTWATGGVIVTAKEVRWGELGCPTEMGLYRF